MKLLSLLWFTGLILICSSGLASQPLVHPLFGDHAVLQRESNVPVWGWSAPGDKITIRFAGQEKTAITGSEGRWQVALDPMPASSEGRMLQVQSPSQAAEIKDILVGDVWICAGQSNMEMGMQLCKEAGEIAKAEHPRIRLLTVPHKIAYSPESTLSCQWQPCSPTSLAQGTWGGFSATAYFFGKNLQEELGVPIGLIQAAWGGTVCQAWTSREALAPLGSYQSDLAQVQQVETFPGPDKVGAAMDQWYQRKDPGTAGQWFKPETDVSAWKTVNLPAPWHQCGIPGYEGIVWVQSTFNLPANWAAQDLSLSLGPISDVDTTWINGNIVGRTNYFDQARVYSVPATTLKPDSNVITIRVHNAGGGGFSGKPEQLSIAKTNKESISLAGAWRLQETATRASTGAPLAGNPNLSSVLFNGMIAPLIPLAIKGTIWYQGESNTSHASQYRPLLSAMIVDWRSRFALGNFGFHIVSLANFKSAAPDGWAQLREAQALTAKSLPHCGLATTIDIGQTNDIHPKNKREVGRRLALCALAITYGKNSEWSGPWFRSSEPLPGAFKIHFDHAQNGLMAKGDEINGFTIAGEDQKFHQARALIDGNSILVSSPLVPRPAAVRYGWAADPQCNLYNREGLPAVPFRTDLWTDTQP